jgi:hypothetical protein
MKVFMAEQNIAKKWQLRWKRKRDLECMYVDESLRCGGTKKKDPPECC